MKFQILLAVLLPTAYTLICTSCPFMYMPPYSTSCNETCEGDLCYIVVNKHFNGTIIAGCLSFRGNETSQNQTAVCNRGAERTMCACTKYDKCNDPTASMSEFDFVDEAILDGYQVLPQIQPTDPSVDLPGFISGNNNNAHGGEINEEIISNEQADSSKKHIEPEIEMSPMPVPPGLPIPGKNDSEIIVTKTIGLQIIEDKRTTSSGPSEAIEISGISPGTSASSIRSTTPLPDSTSTVGLLSAVLLNLFFAALIF